MGKIYKEHEFGTLILAFEKTPKDKESKSKILAEIVPYLNRLAEKFELKE